MVLKLIITDCLLGIVFGVEDFVRTWACTETLAYVGLVTLGVCVMKDEATCLTGDDIIVCEVIFGANGVLGVLLVGIGSFTLIT